MHVRVLGPEFSALSYALDQPGAYEVAGVELSEVEAGEEAKAAGVLRQ